MRRSSAGLLAAACLLGVALLALAPLASPLNDLTVRLWRFFGTDVPIAPASFGPEDYGKLLNVALFVPPAAVLTWFLGRHWGWALPLCIALSVAIELLQRDPALGRQSSAVDIACNAVGATAGVVVAALADEWRRRRAAPEPPE